MRLMIMAATAAILLPAALALAAHPAAKPAGIQSVSDVSAAKKSKKPTKSKSKDDNLKAAPGTGPSGPPSTKDKSSY